MDENGVMRSASEADRRCTIECIHNANEYTKLGLIAMWSNKSPEEAHEILSREDVSVTNQKDKELQLPKIKSFKDSVYQTWLTIPKDEDQHLRTIVRGASRPEGQSPPVSPHKGTANVKSQPQEAFTTPQQVQQGGTSPSFALASRPPIDDASFNDHVPMIEMLTQQLSQKQHTIDSLTQVNAQLSQTNTQLTGAMSRQMDAMSQQNSQLTAVMSRQMTELTSTVSMQAEALSANSPGDCWDEPSSMPSPPKRTRSTASALSNIRVHGAPARIQPSNRSSLTTPRTSKG